MISGYKDSIAWQKGIKIALAMYKLTNEFPKTEIYGLTSQMRRSAVSIPSNIAEGYRRFNRKEYCRFLKIAFASGAELETQIEISKGLGFVDLCYFNEIDSLLDEVMRILNKTISTLSDKI